jgi:formamidopyrimidine-DNA glycosylase
LPELPEVETVKNGLAHVALDREVASVRFYRADLREIIPQHLIKRILIGQKILSFERRSKYILITTSKGTVLSHLGMTGAFLIRRSSKPEKSHTHFVIGLKKLKGKDDVFLHYVDPRRFGRLSATEESPYEHPYLANLGPEPLELTPKKLSAHLMERASGRKSPIKNFIMDAKVVVGVGNIYACESLFKSGISPLRLAGEVDPDEMLILAGYIIKILRKAIKQGGTTIKDFQNAEGGTGYFAISLKVYGRQGLPCSNCKAPIFQVKQSGRSSWYCEICQN